MICRCTGPRNCSKSRKRALHRSPRGQVCIGDNFKAFQSLADLIRRTVRDHPCQLHLRQTDRFRQAVQRENQRLAHILQRQHAVGSRLQLIVAEHFVRDDRQSERAQLSQLVASQKMPGRIIRIDQDNGPRSFVDRAFDRMEVDEPAA